VYSKNSFSKMQITFHRTTSINKLSKVGSITANFNGTIRFCDSTPNKKCPSIPPSFINTFTVLPSRDRLIDGCFSSSVFSKQEAASSFSNSRIKPWSLWRSFISESVPQSASFPSCNTAIRSHILSTSDRIWVEIRWSSSLLPQAKYRVFPSCRLDQVLM